MTSKYTTKVESVQFRLRKEVYLKIKAIATRKQITLSDAIQWLLEKK